MHRTLRPQSLLATLAAILAGLSLAASAIAVSGEPFPAMPGSSCPPLC